MKAVGIIAEYNPFHTGHAYQLRRAKELSGADYSVAVMSPDFVQRGEPAVFDKFTRTEMALRAGADLVLELPVCYACGSAEYFAQGAVSVLGKTGVVDTLCFGAENNQPELFRKASAVLLEESGAWQRILKEGLRRGLTFPEARSRALSDMPELAALLASPNNLLGVEYCKAIRALGAGLTPLPVRRRGSGYHSTALTGMYCSATALRSFLYQRAQRLHQGQADSSKGTSLTDLADSQKTEPFCAAEPYIPRPCLSVFQKAAEHPLFADDFLPVLLHRMLYEQSLTDILDLTPELAARIRSLRFLCAGKTFQEIAELLKTRQITQARIRRVLFHLILEIRKYETELLRSSGPAHYLRVLGFRRQAAPLLHEIKKRSALPLITKAAHASRLLSGTASVMWEQGLLASHLYRSILSARYGLPFRTDYEISPVIIEETL